MSRDAAKVSRLSYVWVYTFLLSGILVAHECLKNIPGGSRRCPPRRARVPLMPSSALSRQLHNLVR